MSENEKCNFKSHLVLMKGITWSRDSHGLFDYESRHLTKRTMKTQDEVQIIRNQNELELLPLKGQPSLNTLADSKPLLNIINDGDQFYLECCQQPNIKVESKELNEQMFLVVRSLKHDNVKIEYDIQQGDILKVGRVKFAVKEIKYKEGMEVETKKDNGIEEFEEYEDVDSIMQCDEDNQSEDDLKRCRFCWQTNASESNPLFTSCKCSGSVGFIHFDCLRNWLEIKKQMKKSVNFSSYYWKAFECEICKKAYPLIIRSGGKTFNLVDYERPEGDFLVLESLNQEKNTSRIIHIISPDSKKDSFKLGRGHESDLRINDISVSRCHAIIKFKDNRFQLEDNLSKFGTLVLVKTRTSLVPGFNKAVQIGRTVINFSVKSLQHNRNFGPRPQEGLITGKLKTEEAKDFLSGAAMKLGNNEEENGSGGDEEGDQAFDACDHKVLGEGNEGGSEEIRGEEIPDELPDNQKSNGF